MLILLYYKYTLSLKNTMFFLKIRNCKIAFYSSSTSLNYKYLYVNPVFIYLLTSMPQKITPYYA